MHSDINWFTDHLAKALCMLLLLAICMCLLVACDGHQNAVNSEAPLNEVEQNTAAYETTMPDPEDTVNGLLLQHIELPGDTSGYALALQDSITALEAVRIDCTEDNELHPYSDVIDYYREEIDALLDMDGIPILNVMAFDLNGDAVEDYLVQMDGSWAGRLTSTSVLLTQGDGSLELICTVQETGSRIGVYPNSTNGMVDLAFATPEYPYAWQDYYYNRFVYDGSQYEISQPIIFSLDGEKAVRQNGDALEVIFGEGQCELENRSAQDHTFMLGVSMHGILDDGAPADIFSTSATNIPIVYTLAADTKTTISVKFSVDIRSLPGFKGGETLAIDDDAYYGIFLVMLDTGLAL